VEDIEMVTESDTPERLFWTGFFANFTDIPRTTVWESVTVWGEPDSLRVIVMECLRATEPEVELRVAVTPGINWAVTVPAPFTIADAVTVLGLESVTKGLFTVHLENANPKAGVADMPTRLLALNQPELGLAVPCEAPLVFTVK